MIPILEWGKFPGLHRFGYIASVLGDLTEMLLGSGITGVVIWEL
jgi:hypothetical protein